MARLSLATRADRIAKRLAGRDLTDLPKTVLTDVDRFASAIGISTERFLTFAPSTRQRYIRAARKGRTAEQERARVREQRKRREEEKRKRPPPKAPPSKMDQIWRLRNEIVDYWGLETNAGPHTEMDQIQAEVLLSDDSIRAHVRVYGEDYVLRHLRRMRDSVADPTRGRINWQAFKASDAYPDDDTDERWWWYHGTARLYTGNESTGGFMTVPSRLK